MENRGKQMIYGAKYIIYELSPYIICHVFSCHELQLVSSHKLETDQKNQKTD
jgi:hypothetical protein